MSSSELEGFTLVRAARTISGGRYPLQVRVKQERSGMPSPDTHIVVRNGWDELVGEGDGQLVLDLERGLYTLRLERGGASREEVIRHIGASEIEPKAPQRSSALPSFDTEDAHEYYSWTAAALSKQDITQGKPVFGAAPAGIGQLFIFVRAVEAGRRPTPNPLQSLFLYDLAGNQLTDFGPEVVSRNESDGWAGFSAPAPAGSYLLRYAGLEPREMVLTVFAGWQTQLFVPYDDRPLLARASLLLARVGQGFNPDDRAAQAVDAGLAGLQSGVDVLPKEQRDALLYGKFEDPMLGLIGAHLLLLQQAPDWNQLNVVLGNLDWLLPGAVDVQALRMAAALRRGEALSATPVSIPPMLRRGLDAIIGASSSSPEVIPEGGVIERIAPYLLAETPWSIWALPEALSGSAEVDTRAWVSRLAAEEVEKMPDLAVGDLGQKLQKGLGDLLTWLGPEASAGSGPALHGLSSGVMSNFVSEARQTGAGSLGRIAHSMLMQGVDTALSTQSERTSLPSSGAEMPAWVRTLLEESLEHARRRGGSLDLAALAQQVKLPLSLLRRWASVNSDGLTSRWTRKGTITMASPTSPEQTTFSLDVLGRYICNGLDEAMRSTDRTVRNDARPFDVIVLGGGTFGAAVASHIFSADIAHRHRILVLEGGPFVLTEHVQDLPMIGLNVPGATSIAALRAIGQDRQPREQVWGLAWHSSTAFPGLAYCVGGRSLYWGGWSPQLIDTEMPTAPTAANPWPQAVVDDLNNRYFREASEQIGVDETNDFIFGPLQNALRQQLFDGLTAGRVTDAIDLSALPDPAAVRALGPTPSAADLLGLLGLPSPSSGSTPNVQTLRNMLKIEAPLAVQTRSLSGFFPFNKFSSVPILMKAARMAFSESGGDDVKKRLMIVPHCHVTRLITGRTQGGLNVLAIETNQGIVPVQAAAPVVIALGTIESTRLTLLALDGEPVPAIAGNNLLAHLRSNLTIRIPRTALAALSPTVQALQAGALIVKGRHQHADGALGHYHLQITAAGLGPMGTDSEAELFKKVPDIDTFDNFRTASESHVVITMRGIGQMETQAPGNRVALDPEADEFGARRAIVSIAPTQKDLALWDAMDKAATDVAAVFAAGGPMEIIQGGPGPVRDGLGTTHHEAGTLWMGDQGPTRSPTDPDCRLNQLTNAFVAAPALLPSTGSPNPMLTGIALARRLGDYLAPPPVPFQPADGTPLFDGFSTANWRMSMIRNQPGRDNPGHFLVVDGALESVTGTDIGLFWCTTAMPPDFILRLDWLRWEDFDNSGVFIRFPNPESKGYNNNAFVAVDFGFEVQIDELGAPDGQDIHKTGAIYRNDGRRDGETFALKPARPVGQWNEYEIRVKGQNYRIFLNGDQVCVFDNPYPGRGLPSTPATPTHIGLQTHTGRVAFRNIRYMAHP